MSLGSPHRTTGEMITASIWNTDVIDTMNSLPVTSDGLVWQGRIVANPQATAPFNASYSAFSFDPVVYKHPIGGVHPSIIGVLIDPPILGAGAATATIAATLLVNGNPTGATSANYALMVGAGGSSVFQGSISLATDVNTGISFDDSRVSGVVGTTVKGYIGPVTGGFFRILATTDVPVLLGTNNVDLVRLKKDNLAIDFGTASGEYLSFQSTGSVAHGFTTDTAAVSFGNLRKASASDGGLSVSGFTETNLAVMLNGQYTTGDTTKATNSLGGIMITGNKLSGSTAGAMATNENLLVLRNNTGTRFIFNGDGQLYYHGAAAATFDEWDDIALARSLDLTLQAPGLIETAWDAFVQYNRADLIRAGILTEGGFINATKHAQLLNGATWQLFQKVQTLAARVAQLEAA